ncbi:MAG: hypothetical protein NUV46_04450 [Nanoarchaeota archaeon]|nr:hypothetical protein [Nanoarchaeota archaeon]
MVKKLKKTNKKGWIKIVEAFLAIVILLGFLMVIITQYKYSNEERILIRENNAAILKNIEKDILLRDLVLSVALPSNSNEPGFPEELKTSLDERMFPGEVCVLNICEIESDCSILDIEKEVYSSEIFIFSGTSEYLPRKLKVSCNFL